MRKAVPEVNFENGIEGLTNSENYLISVNPKRIKSFK